MATLPLPYIILGEGLIEQRESSRKGDVVRLINSLDLVTPEDTIEEPKDSNNYINLSAGVHSGPKLTKPQTIVGGVAGTRISRRALFESTCTVDGVVFENSDTSTGTLVVVRDTAVVLFRNCVFDSSQPAGDKVWIHLEAGAKCIFTGCMWRGGDGVGGTLVNNTGVVADVFVVACIATATAPGAVFVNTTNVAVL